MSDKIELIVRADDFGMCHAVNQGIVKAFREGIVSESSVMVPCPWFAEAAALAKRYSIPVGIHQTLTCEWDYLRWRPVTDGASLTDKDGTFYRSVMAAREAITHEDAVTELMTQALRFTDEGLEIDYLDVHMGAVAPAAYAETSTRLGKLFVYSAEAEARGLKSISALSEREEKDKKDWLLGYLSGLEAGVHMLVVHPAIEGEEISSITAADSEPYRWAEEYRVSDLQILTDSDVCAAVRECGIELTSVGRALDGA